MRKIRSKQFTITDFHEKKFETYKLILQGGQS